MAERTGLIPLREKIGGLERVYGRVQKEIASELFSVEIMNYQEIKSMKVQERINALIKKLNRMAIRWVKESVPIAYRKSYVVAKTSLEILGAKKDVLFNAQNHRLSVDGYIERTMKDLVNANQSIKNNVNMYLYLARRASAGLMQIQQFDPGDEEIISSIITDTMEAGRERAYASKRIHEYLRLKLLDGNFIDKAGRNYNLRSYSKMVARTRLRQAQTDAVKNTCEQYENDLVQVSQHASPCDKCAPYEGKVYSLSGRHPTYPFFDINIPLHPNCEHNISPTSEAALEVREEFREKPYVIEAGAKPGQAKIASLDDALKELPRRHVMRVEKYYIDNPSKMHVDVPHFKGEAAGYWQARDKSIHLSSKLGTNKRVIFHEVGHAAYETGIVPYPQKPLWKAWHKKATNLQIKYPSQYALTNEGEFFAECYSHYYLKNYHLIDDGIKKWFDKTLKF